MHWQTWEQLRHKYNEAEADGWVWAARHLRKDSTVEIHTRWQRAVSSKAASSDVTFAFLASQGKQPVAERLGFLIDSLVGLPEGVTP